MMRRQVIAAAVAIGIVAMAGLSQAQQGRRGGRRGATGPPAVMPEENTGIKVGEKIPDFKLKDSHGKEVALKDLLKPGEKLAIVFHRSADW